MMFQHMCHIKVSPEDVEFARKALCTPGMVEPEKDLIIGKFDVWDGDTVEIRLCGVPDQPAFMAAAVFGVDKKLRGYCRAETYQQSFQFQIGNLDYLVMLCEDKSLSKDAVKAHGAKEKTPSRHKRGQQER